MAATASAPAIPAPAGRARWTRLIPGAIIVYVISFMDRTNIGFAFDGMGQDLHLASAAKGLAGGIFFIGYQHVDRHFQCADGTPQCGQAGRQ